MSNKPLANPTAFTGQAPPWSLTQLDANFTAIQNTINDTLTYSNYFVDQSGVANSVIVSIPTTLAVALTAGTLLCVKIANTNTATATITINALAAQTIINPDGSLMSPKQLFAGSIALLGYDGINFQFLGSWLSPALRRTSPEVTAGTVPVDYSKWPSPWKDISRYVTDNTGGTDVSAQFANALAAETNIIVPQGTYNLGSTGIVLNAKQRFECAGRNAVKFTYSGAGIAVDGFGKNDLTVCDCTIDTTANVAATGMRFGNGAQQIYLSNVELQGNQTAGNTGVGLLLDASNPGKFSGNLIASLFYCLGYKFGVKMTGADVGTNTWTSVSFIQSYLLGRASGIIAGSIGLWMDSKTNGVGSVFHGGTIESFATGLQVDTGGYGLDFVADNEGNTTAYTVGSTFVGRIKLLDSSGNSLEAAANGTTNRWFQRQQLNGVLTEEVYTNQRFVTYDDSGSQAQWALYRGPTASSFISGTANPTKKFAVNMGVGADAVGARNYLILNGQTIHWDTQSPQTTALGTWAKGDICYNSNATVGSPAFWLCTVAGSPGTWVASANL